jgi:hypothetical protein
MDLKAFPLLPADKPIDTPGMSRMQGVVNLPQNAKIVHVGAAPPNGEMYVYAEVSPMNLPIEPMDVVVLKVDDTIPRGFEYLSYILAVPILFVYRRKKDAIIT